MIGKVLGAAGVGGDEGQVDLGLLHLGKLDLGLLAGFLDALEGHAVVAQVDALVLLELVAEPVHDALVEVIAAEVGIAGGRFHLESAVAELEDGDIEGAAAEVVDGDGLLFLLVQSVGKGGGRRLVDDAQHVQSGDLRRHPWWPGAGRR